MIHEKHEYREVLVWDVLQDLGLLRLGQVAQDIARRFHGFASFYPARS